MGEVSAMGEARQNSIVLAAFTHPTVLLSAYAKKVQVLSSSMYLLEVIVPTAIVLEG